LTVIRQAGTGGGAGEEGNNAGEKPDGKKAFEVLKKKYDTVTTSTVVALLKRAFDIKQNGTIEQHLVRWQDLMRKFSVPGADMAIPPKMEAVMFLRTLTGNYKNFYDDCMMHEQLDPTEIYLKVVNYKTSCLTDVDERTAGHGALAVGNMCRFGVKCRFADCSRDHPRGWNPGRGGGRGRGRGRGGRGSRGRGTKRNSSSKLCPVFGDDCRQLNRDGRCRHNKRGSNSSAHSANLVESLQKKVKNQKEALAGHQKKAKAISEAMIADGRTDKSQRYGAQVVIMEDPGEAHVSGCHVANLGGDNSLGGHIYIP